MLQKYGTLVMVCASEFDMARLMIDAIMRRIFAIAAGFAAVPGANREVLALQPLDAFIQAARHADPSNRLVGVNGP
jgi:hypothetical protein